MDFKNFKKNIWYFTKKLQDTSTEITDNLAKKFSHSSFVLKNEDELKEFIKKSKNTISSETWKIFKKRVLVIFWEEKSNFYKEMLKFFPILFTKSWVTNTSIRLIDKKNIDLKKYNVSFLPSLIVFENEEFLKEIPWKNNIVKIVKNTTMDIDKLIDEIKLDEPIKDEENNSKNEKKEEQKKEK